MTAPEGKVTEVSASAVSLWQVAHSSAPARSGYSGINFAISNEILKAGLVWHFAQLVGNFGLGGGFIPMDEGFSSGISMTRSSENGLNRFSGVYCGNCCRGYCCGNFSRSQQGPVGVAAPPQAANTTAVTISKPISTSNFLSVISYILL